MSIAYTLTDVFSEPLSSIEQLFSDINYRVLDESDWETLNIGPYTDVGNTLAIQKVNTFALHILTDLNRDCGSTWYLALSDPFIDDSGEFISNGWINDLTSNFGKSMSAIVKSNHSNATEVNVSTTISNARFRNLGELSPGIFYYAFTYDENDPSVYSGQHLFGRVAFGPYSTLSEMLSSGSYIEAVPVSHVPDLIDQFCKDFVELVAVSILKKQDFGGTGSFYTDNTTTVSLQQLTNNRFILGTQVITFDDCRNNTAICLEVPSYSFQEYLSIPSSFVRNISQVVTAQDDLQEADPDPDRIDIPQQPVFDTPALAVPENNEGIRWWVWLIIGILGLVIIGVGIGIAVYFGVIRKSGNRGVNYDSDFERRREYSGYPRYPRY